MLENAGFLRGKNIITDQIAYAKRSKLIDIAMQSAELTPTSSVTGVGSIFSHTASLSLSGDPLPCAGAECRMKNARKLAQFAAFYSDRVFINNGLFTFGSRHLTCMVPFLNGVSADELLELRKSEADAFISFRHGFAKAVDAYIKAKIGKLTEQDAEAIFRDVIEPKLARLNQKVSTASKSVFRKSSAGVLGWAAAISIGFYFGFVESSLIAAAKALGLTKVAADLTAGLLETKGQDVIRDENMYFLWKVYHRAQRF
jgi:hypothetical protein